MQPCRFREGGVCRIIREAASKATVSDATCEQCQASGPPIRGNAVVEREIHASVAAQLGLKPAVRDWRMSDLPCVHRGQELRTVTCNVCGDRGALAPVFDCEIHGACIRAETKNSNAPKQHCLTCEDRSEVVTVPCPPRECGPPQISIVMPAYNAARWIKQAIQSIVDQTYGRWELVVVDDGSTDDTFFIASALAARDRRIRVMRQGNGGTGAALNAGFKAIGFQGGEYETWWSADSFASPEWLGSLCEELHCCKVDFVYGDWSIFNESTRATTPIITPEFDHHRHQSRCEVGCCWMWRRELRLKAGPWALNVCEDYEMWLRMADLGTFKRVAGNLGFWRQHDSNLSLECNANGWKDSCQIVARHKFAKADIRVAMIHEWLDPAGVGWLLARGMNESRDSIAVRHILHTRSAMQQQDDLIIGEDDAEIDEVLKQATVWHLQMWPNSRYMALRRPDQALIHHDHCGVFALQADKMQRLRDMGCTFLSCAPGIEQLIPDSRWVPNPMPLDPTGFAWYSDLYELGREIVDEPVKIQMSHNYACGKGADAVLWGIDEIRRVFGIELEHNVRADHTAVVPFRQHLQASKAANVLIDNFTQGFIGMSGWEGLAHGQAVLARLDERAIREYTALGEGEPPPIINCLSQNEFVAALLDLHRNPVKLTAIRKASREWAIRWYSQERIVGKWADVYNLCTEQ